MRSNKQILAIALATAAISTFATDYTWNGGTSGDWENSSNWTGGDGTSYPLAATDKAIIPVTATTSIYFKPSSASTIAAEINFPKSSTANAEARLIRNTGFDVTFTGKFTGDGIVRLAADTTSGAGASSAQSIILDNDQSEFEGTFYFNSTWKDRFQLGTSLQPSQKARYIVAGTQAGNIQYNGTSNAVFSFGSFYTASIINRTSAIRFNTASATPVLEVGAANGKMGDDRLTVQMGDNNSDSCSYVKIRKVGTGNLVLGDTRHSKGTEINGGTVTLVHKNALLGRTTGDISFGGGTLVYGESVYDDNDADGNVKGEKVTTDYSAYIKNSTAAIAIDTNDRDVTFATALAASNQGGLVKKGKGALVLSEMPKYTGATVVENGSLVIPVNYTVLNKDKEANFRVESGASITYVNLNNSQITNIGTVVGTAIVNLDRKAGTQNRMWRCMEYPFGGESFTGTLNFLNGDLAERAADGLVYSAPEVGNSNVVWGVLGAASARNGRIFDIVTRSQANTVYMGALRQTDPNAATFIRWAPTLEIGARSDTDSVIEGALALSPTGATGGAIPTIRKIGSGKLTLGTDFRIIAENDLNTAALGTRDTTTNYPALHIAAGTFENNADLTKYPAEKITLADNVVLSGSGTWPENMMLPASYHVAAVTPGDTPKTLDLDVDFARATLANLPTADTVAALDTEKTYTIFAAKSIANWSTAEIAVRPNGRWKVVQRGSSLVLKFFHTGFAVILR